MTSVALDRPLVLADALPLRDAVLVAGGAGLTILGAQIAIHIPPSPVPVTGQTLAVVVAGAALGARRGAASQLLYVLLGLFLPVYSDGASGIDVIWGATGGYLVGFVLAAGAIGWVAERGYDRRRVTAIADLLRRPADHLRDRRAVAEGLNRHVLGRRDPQRVHDLHRRRADQGRARGHRHSRRVAPGPALTA